MKKVTRIIIRSIGACMVIGGVILLMKACLDEISFNGLDLAGFFLLIIGAYMVFAREKSLLSWGYPDDDDEDE